MSDMDQIKKRLLRSSTMPAGTGKANGSPFTVLQSGHVHKNDGSCCGGHHHHAHEHNHDHDHEDDDVTNPKGGCCG